MNPRHVAYLDYGGRGITICPEWAASFEAFLEHVGPKPSPEHSLDRLDNNLGYLPGNVRWASWLAQANNRRPNRGHLAKQTAAILAEMPLSGDTNFKHGLVHRPEYKVWIAMKDRCLNPKSSNYPHWGGRGIKIQESWVYDFVQFLSDVGVRPGFGYSLDRFPDNDGNYEKGNVRWATRAEQNANRRPCKTGPTHGNSTHGQGKTHEYHVWGGIKTKCFNPKSDRYATYGGVGITICQRWRDDFETFLSDLGPSPSPKHVLMRLDRAANFSCGVCPECKERGWAANCRWGTITESNRARSTSSRSGKLTVDLVRQIRDRLKTGETMPSVAKAFDVGVSLIGKIKRRENWA